MKVKPCIIILNTSRKHVNYEEDKNKVHMNKPYNIQNKNICNGIFHISFYKALLINEGETTRGERESGQMGIGEKRPGFFMTPCTCGITKEIATHIYTNFVF